MQSTSANRNVVYYVATTIDHYIAHEDQTLDGFLMDGHHVADYLDSLRGFDTVLMGRRTYEWGYQFGVEPGKPVPTYGHMMQYVFSRTMPEYRHEQLRVVRDEPADFVRTLKAEPGKSIYLCGGGKLAGYLLQQNVVDELILKVNPVAFGRGIPAFGDLERNIELSLLDTKIYNSGVIFLHYRISSV